jgi:hypothetical protein
MDFEKENTRERPGKRLWSIIAVNFRLPRNRKGNLF